MLLNTNSIKPALLTKTKKRKVNLADASKLQGKVDSTKVNDLLPNLIVETRPIGSLEEPAKLVRSPTTRQLMAMTSAIGANGFVVPMLVHGKVIVDGVVRYRAAKKLGLPHVPVIDLAHLSPAQCELLKIGMHRIAADGEWDLEVLREMVIEIEVNELDLDATGFTTAELDIIKLDPIEGDQLDEVPPLEPGAAISRVGDLWQLGQHRLLCGDALLAANYATLMDDATAAMVLSDFPYNVAIANNVSGLGKTKHGEFVQASGEMSDEEFCAWLASALSTIASVTSNGAVMQIFMDWRHISHLIGAGTAAGLNLINLVVWNKTQGGMGSLYRSAHELIAVFCAGATTPTINHVKLGKHGRDRTNVWNYPGATTPGSSAAKMIKDHPTPKPVEMLVDAMLDVTDPSSIVLDPFMGSGSTIIAAEECGRHARGIELDPKYVDVAVRRWEKATGEQAILIETDETFDEVRDRRGAEAVQQ